MFHSRSIPTASRHAARATRQIHTHVYVPIRSRTLQMPITRCRMTPPPSYNPFVPNATNRCFSTATTDISSQRSSATCTTSSPPGGWVGPLSSHSVLRITSSSPSAPAAELLKYLHNLTTQDMYHTVSAEGGRGYTMCLNSKGRVLFDTTFFPIDSASLTWLQQSVAQTQPTVKGPAAIAKSGLVAGPVTKPPTPQPSQTPRGFYFIVHSSVKQQALDHLAQFNLRRKARIEDVSNQIEAHQAIPFQVLEEMRAGIIEPVGSSTFPQANFNALVSVPDPRGRVLGQLVLARRGENVLTASSPFHLVPSSFLDTYRILLGFSSSPDELIPGSALPLEHSLIEAHGVSFEKGCYLGQELTARTHYQGVVRKKVWPVFVARAGEKKGMKIEDWMAPMEKKIDLASKDPLHQLKEYFPFFDPSAVALPHNSPIFRAPAKADPPASVHPKEVAHVLSSSHNLALAMLRSEHVEDDFHSLKVSVDETTTAEVVPYQPTWWSTRKA